VLSRLPKAERDLLDVAIVQAADAVEMLLADGPEATMTKFNATSV
jgi:peptidyl-tRNA hydrolase